MRILHTMLRVGNLDKSLAFYTQVLGMKLLRRKEYPDGRFTLAFVGYQDEADGTVLEQGAAVAGNDSLWAYTTTTALPAGQSVMIEVTATDRPGHKTTKTQARG